MAGMKLEAFQGMIPRGSDRLLPPMAATIARNTKLLSGEIRGFRALALEADLTGCTSVLRRAYRVPTTATPTVGDPYWNDVLLLAKFDGTDAATAYTELARAEVGVFSGTAQLDTAQAAGGTASLLVDGNSDVVSFGDNPTANAAYTLTSTDDVTVEAFVRFNTLPTVSSRATVATLGNQDFVTFDMEVFNNAGTYQLRGRFGFGNTPAATITPSTGVWYHMAIQRRYAAGNTQVDLLFNGVRVGQVTSNNNPSSVVDPVDIGAFDNASNDIFSRFLDGHIDSVRYTKAARYGDVSTYTVPDADMLAFADSPAPSEWLCFDSREVDVVRSPLVNDTHDRYYWAGDGRPMMNTAARIAADDPPYYLGIPTPASAPVVSPPGGSDETRAYVYTFESSFGEEGPPSPPTIVTGNSVGTWEITSLPTAAPDAAFRDVTKINIYRTVAGNASTSFFFVAEVPIAAGAYSDDVTNEEAATNNLLESTAYLEPPIDMEGFVVMPNGYLVGWAGRRLLLSEPFRPHAWPAQYEQSTEFEIVGLAVFGSTLVICTESQPYFGQGVSPASFTTQKIDTVEPCLSRRGIVTTPAGALYPSINGLVLANSSGINVVTKELFTKSEWTDLNPTSFYAAQLGLQYICFSSPSFGFIVDPENPTSRYVELDNFTNVEGIETDKYTGNVLILAQDRVYQWDPESVQRLQWRWQSKVWHFPKPMNFGAARLKFEVGDTSGALPVTTVYRPYNEELFEDLKAEPGVRNRLNTLGGQVLGGVPAKPVKGLVPTQPTIIENRQPLGGSMIYDLAFLQLTTLSVRVRISIRPQSKDSKVIFDKQILDENIFRLPTGFKSDLWQIEMIGNTTVYSLQIAETPKQLAEV